MSDAGRRTITSRFWLHFFLAAAILYGVALWTMGDETFFTSDTGLRLWQVRQLIAKEWQTFAVDYPFLDQDPGLAHIPYYYAFALHDGQVFLSLTPYFTLISSFLYYFLDSAALPILPVAGTLLSAASIYGLAGLSGIGRRLALFWATILATPLLFYTFEFWDHSLGVGLAVAGIFLAARGIQMQQARWLAAGGALLSLASGQRIELYVLIPAFVIAQLIVTWPRWRLLLPLAAGGFLAALPQWLFNYYWFGQPLGIVLTRRFGVGIEVYSGHRSPTYEQSLVKSRFFVFIEPGDVVTLVAALLLLTGFGLFFLALRLPQKRRTYWFLWCGFGLLAAGTALSLYVARLDPLIGLLSTFPLLPWALAYLGRKDDRFPAAHTLYRLLFLTVLLFYVFVVAYLRGYGGSQWGVRYGLVVYPLLLYLAYHGYAARLVRAAPSWRRAMQQTFYGLLLASVVLQLAGVGLLHRAHRDQLEIKTAVERLPAELVISNSPFLPSFMSSLDKEFLYADEQEELVYIFQQLAGDEPRSLAIVPVAALPLPVPLEVPGVRVRQVDDLIYEIQRE